MSSAGLERWRARPFHAPPWARGPHLQTVGAKLLRPESGLALRREVWETPDGDELVLDFGPEPPGADVAAPLVVVLHGLEGHSRRRYVLLLVRELHDCGVAAVAMNFRGCARPNRLPRAYHSGDTADLRFVLEQLAERHPGRPLGTAGFSLGGNVVLKQLAEAGADGPVEAAAAISVPYDLAAGADVLERSLAGRGYARYFLRSLVRKVRGKRVLLEGRIDVDAALASATIRSFDERVTAPLHGFRNADHYYEASSSGPVVGDVRVPTLLLHARDDPFLPWERVPVAAAEANPAIRTVFPGRGGHVGFVEGPPWAPRFWAEETAASFLATALARPPGRRDPSTAPG